MHQYVLCNHKHKTRNSNTRKAVPTGHSVYRTPAVTTHIYPHTTCCVILCVVMCKHSTEAIDKYGVYRQNQWEQLKTLRKKVTFKNEMDAII